MNGIFDSHAHYDDERFDADRDELLESIHREGVEYIMTIGADLPTSYAARELAERYDFVYFAAGIHPEQAGDAPENYLEELKALAAHPKCRAIGEIGLDYYWAENPPKERQMELFRQQVLLAKELGLPVIIHDREAHADTLALLRELHPAGVLHCFSGSVEMAKEVAALGMYLGFTGAITFKNARRALETSDPEELRTLGREAADLYQGDFLPDAADELWCADLHAYYRSLFVRLFRRLVQELMRTQEYTEAAALCAQAVHLDPLSEEFSLLLMQNLTRSHQAQQALDELCEENSKQG